MTTYTRSIHSEKTTICMDSPLHVEVSTVEFLKSQGNYASFKVGVLAIRQPDRMHHVSS